MRSCCAISGFSSTLTLTSRTLPLAARTTFSRMGVSCLQGPHHGAQKSTITGVCIDAWMTSWAKVLRPLSLIKSASPAFFWAALPAKSCIGSTSRT